MALTWTGSRRVGAGPPASFTVQSRESGPAADTCSAPEAGVWRPVSRTESVRRPGPDPDPDPGQAKGWAGDAHSPFAAPGACGPSPRQATLRVSLLPSPSLIAPQDRSRLPP